jgi:hypothetical protein
MPSEPGIKEGFWRCGSYLISTELRLP